MNFNVIEFRAQNFQLPTMKVDLDGLFDQNSTYDYDNYEDPEAGGSEAIWIPVLYSVVLLFGLAGNGLLLAVLVQKRQMWSLSDTFILHLCVSDILLLVTLPFRAAQAAHHLCLGIFCKISGAVFNINFYCGIFLLVYITLDHYLSTVHAVHLHSHRVPSVAHIGCLAVWLVSLLLSIPDWIFLEAKENLEQGKMFCVHNYSQSGFSWQHFSRLLYHIVGFLLPTAVLIWCFSHILLRRLQSSKGLQRQRAVMVILPLVVGFLLCWTPYNVTLFVDTNTNDSGNKSSVSSSSLKVALMATSALGCFHACVRPLLYLLLCGNFKKQILSLLKCTAVRCESSLWELGVGEEAPHDQSHSKEEIQRMTTDDQQVQSVQL